MTEWSKQFKFNPIHPLINSKNEAITYFTRRDLLGEEVKSIETLWKLPIAIKIIKKQKDDGSWKYPGKSEYGENKTLFETYKNLGLLVEKYGFNNQNNAIRKAAEYIFSCQTEEGDIRGIYGTQYAPNYSSAIMEHLIHANYEREPRVEKFFKWILSMRQDDGGWASPLRTNKVKYLDVVENSPPLKPFKSKPFSHMMTGVVLRAFAAHPKYRKSNEAKKAGKLLASRFFKADKYPDRRTPEYWEKFTYPFFWTDLLSSLDSLSLIGFTKNEPEIKTALEWFVNKQNEDGTWHLKMLTARGDKNLKLWIGLAISRVFKRIYRVK